MYRESLADGKYRPWLTKKVVYRAMQCRGTQGRRCQFSISYRKLLAVAFRVFSCNVILLNADSYLPITSCSVQNRGCARLLATTHVKLVFQTSLFFQRGKKLQLNGLHKRAHNKVADQPAAIYKFIHSLQWVLYRQKALYINQMAFNYVIWKLKLYSNILFVCFLVELRHIRGRIWMTLVYGAPFVLKLI